MISWYYQLTKDLFPARAGVILGAEALQKAAKAIPRTRGGDPTCANWREKEPDYSPHARG